MLSSPKLKEYKSCLDNVNMHCRLIRLGSKNLETKIKQQDFQEQQKLIGIEVSPFIKELTSRVNSFTFLMLISEFERVLYETCIAEGKRLKEDILKSFSAEKFLEFFVEFKTKDDFYSFSSVKKIYAKISAKDVEYISELIAIRNFIAHGKKEKDTLEKYDINLINDLDTITKKLQELLDKLHL